MEHYNESGIPAYGKIYALGHLALMYEGHNFLDGVTWVQEKLDGSQFSFGVLDGHLRIRSKGKEIFQEAPENMFQKGVDYVRSIQDLLVPGWIYRSEFLCRPKHNTLAYSRVPNNHIALYDVMTAPEQYLTPARLAGLALLLGVEAVPILQQNSSGRLPVESFQDMMKTESFLGGQTIEGVVIKNYGKFCQHTGHVLMGKYVSEAFKEVHKVEWRESNPGRNDILEKIIDKYKTPARWEKAVYRLRDEGNLEGSPRDIGGLIKSVWPDIVSECEEEIKQDLWKHFSKHIARAVVSGLPEWYKKRLAAERFEEGAAAALQGE